MRAERPPESGGTELPRNARRLMHAAYEYLLPTCRVNDRQRKCAFPSVRVDADAWALPVGASHLATEAFMCLLTSNLFPN